MIQVRFKKVDFEQSCKIVALFVCVTHIQGRSFEFSSREGFTPKKIGGDR